jgi:hypothetical protein
MSNKIDLSGGFNRLKPHNIVETKNAMFAHAKTYANMTARESDATLTADDINTVAIQTNEKSMWLLTANGPPPVWVELPVAYVPPTFSAFGIAAQTTPLEVGDAIATARTFTWTTTSPSNVEANSVALMDVTGGMVPIASGLADDSSEATAYPAAIIRKVTALSHTFRIRASSSRGISFTRDYTVSWYWRRFSGASALAGPLVEAEIEGLTTKDLAAGFAGTYVLGANNYKYICYAAALGTATSFVDAGTGFAVAMEPSYTVDVTNPFGVDTLTSYRVHRTTNTIVSAINIVVA